jgi:hypothetical protein
VAAEDAEGCACVKGGAVCDDDCGGWDLREDGCNAGVGDIDAGADVDAGDVLGAAAGGVDNVPLTAGKDIDTGIDTGTVTDADAGTDARPDVAAAVVVAVVVAVADFTAIVLADDTGGTYRCMESCMSGMM